MGLFKSKDERLADKQRKENMKAQFNHQRDLKKKHKINTHGNYLSGGPDWPLNSDVTLFINDNDNCLLLSQDMNEATLPFDRILGVRKVMESEIKEEVKKGSLTKGIATTALLGPVAGVIVGTQSTKTKKKAEDRRFLYITYLTKDKEESTMVFQAPEHLDKPLYFQKFVKELNKKIPLREVTATIMEL